MKILKFNWNFIIGLIIISLSLIWIFQNAQLFYWYHYTELSFIVMQPDWVLFFQIILGVINFCVGYKILMKKLIIKKGLLLFLLLLFIGVIIDHFYFDFSEYFGIESLHF